MRAGWRNCPLPLKSAVLGCLLLMLLLACLGCPKKESFDPPDVLYLFATYPVGRNPTSVSTADFNGDGITDILTTNIANNTLSVLFGVGDGSFQEQIKIPTCREPRSVALSDYNRDDLIDLAVACSGSDQVSVLFGHGTGRFGVGPGYSMHRTPVSIATGDVNGDTFADLLVALRNDKIQVLIGQGNGSFFKGSQYEYGDTPTSIAVADLNADHNLDMAVTNGGRMSNAVSIWLGKGDGRFRAPTDYLTGKRPLRVTFGDFDNDLVKDLLVLNGERDTFTIFLGNGDGTFKQGMESGANAGPVFGLVRDFDGDRFVDVAIANIQSHDVSILYGRGDGTFRYPPRNYLAKRGPFAMATFHRTTQALEEPGLVVVNNGEGSVSVFLHRGIRSLSRPDLPQPS